MTAEVWKVMATKKRHVKAVIQFRRAKESEWQETNPILRLGEPALSTDKNKIKVGVGDKHWSELDYLTGEIELDYLELANLPSINEVTLMGDKDSSDLGLQEEMDALLESDIDRIIFGGI